MSEEWSMDGDLGLSTRKSSPDVKNSTRSRADSCSSCRKQDKAPRKALIRTLSGSWVKGGDHRKSSRSWSYDGSLDWWLLTLAEAEGQGRRTSGPRRNSSLACCPEVLRTLRRKLSNQLDKPQNVKGDGKFDQKIDTESLLKEANKTISALQAKLDVYEGLLYGKAKASEVLLKKLSETVRERARIENCWQSESREQRMEAGRLQFQLLSYQENVTDNQRNWLDRLNSVVKENGELQSTVQTQARLIRKLSLDRTAWQREYEELCTLQDAKERSSNQELSAQLSERGKTAEQAVIELAILGSCACRGKKQEPCACAKSACRRQSQVGLLQKKVSELLEQKDEMQHLMEIYREAFEEQLDRNRALTKKVAQLDRENEILSKSGKLNALLRIRLHKDSQSNVISSLVDLVCDRTDALLQQQVLTKLLSRRLTELEQGTSQ